MNTVISLEDQLEEHLDIPYNKMTLEAYSLWYKRKRSLEGKITRAKQREGILMPEKEFKELYASLDESYMGLYLLTEDQQNRLTPRQRNKLYFFSCANHTRGS